MEIPYNFKMKKNKKAIMYTETSKKISSNWQKNISPKGLKPKKTTIVKTKETEFISKKGKKK